MNKALKAVRMIYENSTKHDWPKDIWDAIEDAMAQPEQEPVVGTKTWFEDGKLVTQHLHPSDIYTTPPQRTWVGLAPEDMPAGNNPMFDTDEFALGAAWAQAKLKEKNT